MSAEEISKLLKYCYLRFYLRPRFVLKELRKGRFKVLFEVVMRAVKGGEEN